MPDLLIKDVELEDKERLRVQAAQHGHSMQEELRIIFHEGVSPSPGKSWYSALRGAFDGLEAEGFALPERQAPRKPVEFA